MVQKTRGPSSTFAIKFNFKFFILKKLTTEEYEQGTYVFFDYEKGNLNIFCLLNFIL